VYISSRATRPRFPFLKILKIGDALANFRTAHFENWQYGEKKSIFSFQPSSHLSTCPGRYLPGTFMRLPARPKLLFKLWLFIHFFFCSNSSSNSLTTIESGRRRCDLYFRTAKSARRPVRPRLYESRNRCARRNHRLIDAIGNWSKTRTFKCRKE
jgi:hypothetical protein